jgi:putative ABC transport system substrate-binding protein
MACIDNMTARTVHLSSRQCGELLVGRITARATVIAVLFLAAALAEAQPAGKVPRVAVVWIAAPPAVAQMHDGFRQGLRERGWVEGQTVAIEAQYADGKAERLPGIMTELVASKVDVIVAPSEAVAKVAVQATQSIPIVFANVGDASAMGLVASFARPGGNITGLSTLGTELVPKSLELFREVIPRLSRVAVLLNAAHPAKELHAGLLKAEAERLKFTFKAFEVRAPDEIEGVVGEIARWRADALVVTTTPGLLQPNRARIAEAALRHRLPVGAHGPPRDFVEAGFLFGYGSDPVENLRSVAAFVDKILRGARPADLPVEQPTRFQLMLNLRTARSLGLTIPSSVVLRADHVIE